MLYERRESEFRSTLCGSNLTYIIDQIQAIDIGHLRLVKFIDDPLPFHQEFIIRRPRDGFAGSLPLPRRLDRYRSSLSPLPVSSDNTAKCRDGARLWIENLLIVCFRQRVNGNNTENGFSVTDGGSGRQRDPSEGEVGGPTQGRWYSGLLLG